MGDFYQNGIVTTLHNLSRRPVEELERELLEFSRKRPLGLILPSLFSELEGEALPAILDELQKVPYLAQIVVAVPAGPGFLRAPATSTPRFVE